MRLVVLFTLVCGCLAAPLQYHIGSDSSVAILSPDGTRLFTFDAQATMTSFLASPLVEKLGSACEWRNVQGLSPFLPLATVLHRNEQMQKEGSNMVPAELMCNGQRVTFKASPLIDWHPKLSLDVFRDPSFILKASAHYKRMMDTPRDYPFAADDIVPDGIAQLLAWGFQFITHHWGPIHPFPTYVGTNDTGIYHLNSGAKLAATGESAKRRVAAGDDSEIRVAISADWGAGTREADYVAKTMMLGFDPHYTVHVGDVYLLGTPDEFKSNVLGIAPKNVKQGVFWPHGSLGTFGLNGNHEMYSRGYGYFDLFLPTIGVNDAQGKPQGQKASYWVLENQYWRIIGLDTGYKTYSPLINNDDNPQPQEIIDWLTNVVKISDPTDKRGIIFLSHHQYNTAFGKPYLSTPQQIAGLVPTNRTVVWLWGHEHRLSFYKLTNAGGLPLYAYGRCMGVGGFPVSLGGIPPDAKATGLAAYDDRQYETITGLFNMSVGYNGFVHATFKADTVKLQYRSLTEGADGKIVDNDSTLLVEESFQVDAAGNAQQTSFNIVDPGMTIITSA